MKLWIVSRSVPHHGAGGMESVAWDLAHALSGQGAQVTIVTTSQGAVPERRRDDRVELIALKCPAGRYSSQWWAASRAHFLTNGGDVDVVVGVSAAANAMVGARRAHPSTRFVFQAHGTSSGEVVSKIRSGSVKAWASAGKNIYWGVRRDRVYRRYDAIVAVGEAVERQLLKHPTRFLTGRTPVVQISNGVSSEIFEFDRAAREAVRRRYGIPADATLLISICRLHPQKGLVHGLAAFEAAAAERGDLRYLIVGSGPQSSEIRETTRRRGLNEQVLLLDAAARDDVPALLSAADGFVLPTLRVEGLPVTVLEALASGLPVITSAHGADANLPCIRVQPTDHLALAAALGRITSNDTDRGSRLPERYTIGHSAAQYLRLFCGLAGQAAHP